MHRDMPFYRIALPETLTEIPKPSIPLLWIEARDSGALEVLNRLPERGLAIVGTRQAHPGSMRFICSLMESLRDSQLVILSGLAKGVDAMAHEAAMAVGLPTIAVLGSGIETTYPESSRSIRREIVRNGGLVLSEFPPEAEPRPYRFVQRNRLIAAWSKATCMIQAGSKSGALITVDYALQLHRTVFALPAFPGTPGFEGNQRILDEHGVHALWGAHSLGACWLELATLGNFFRLPASCPSKSLET
jgi:DNA processing protein